MLLSQKSKLSIFVNLNSNWKNLIFLPNLNSKNYSKLNSDLLKFAKLELELEQKSIEVTALIPSLHNIYTYKLLSLVSLRFCQTVIAALGCHVLAHIVSALVKVPKFITASSK